MTGQWPQRHGVFTVGSSSRGSSRDRKLIPTVNREDLDTAHITLMEVMKQQGYATIHAGKWHLGKNPLDHGFDVNIGGGPNGLPRSYNPPYGNVNIASGKNRYLTDLIMEKTVEYIESADQPFFLNYSPYAVHTPLTPVESLLGKYNEKPPVNGQHNATYASMIENMDRNIGILFSSLEKENLLGNTLVIFTSDNGGIYSISKQLPLRAGKGSYYEGGIRVPCFILWEGIRSKGRSSDIPISHLDLFPTLLNIIGVNTTDHSLDGRDLKLVLRNKRRARRKLDQPLFWHFPVYLQAYDKQNNENRDKLFRTRPGSAMRYGNWKLHYYFEDGSTELYNLSEDIGEKNDLSNAEPEILSEMLNMLQSWLDQTNAPIPREINPDYAGP
jgi:arylsulfatase A-like enzyme